MEGEGVIIFNDLWISLIHKKKIVIRDNSPTNIISKRI